MGVYRGTDKVSMEIIPVPWFSYRATHFLKSILTDSMLVFEWGSGGSTLFFSRHAEKVISIEHSAEWFGKIKLLISECNNVNYQLIIPEMGQLGDDKANPYDYLSGSIGDVNFQRYASAIDDEGPFDIIVVDGRSRPSCLMHAKEVIRPGGWIILDNTERSYYLEQTVCLFNDWESITYFGYGPYISWLWGTIFWQCPR